LASTLFSEAAARPACTADSGHKPRYVILVEALCPQAAAFPHWVTQLGQRLRHVRKGEHGTPIIFWKWLSREVEKDDGTVAERHFPMLRYCTVFKCRADRRMSATG
jgi:antirestriction protein ArdC